MHKAATKESSVTAATSLNSRNSLKIRYLVREVVLNIMYVFFYKNKFIRACEAERKPRIWKKAHA